MTRNFIQRIVSTVRQEPNFGRQSVQVLNGVQAQQNLQPSKSAFQPELHSDRKAMSLAFKRQIGNEFGRTREQMFQAQEISSDRLDKCDGRIAPLCFDFLKRGIVFGQTFSDLPKLEMVAWEEVIYRGLMVIGSRPAAIPETNKQQYEQQRCQQDIDDMNSLPS